MRRRARSGELLAALGGAALLGLLFADWYRTPAGGSESGWSGLGWFAVLLAVLVALAGLGLLGLSLTERSPAIPVGAAVATLFAGLAGVLAIGWRALDEPGDNAVTDVRAAAWLAVGAAALVVLGAWLALRDERTDVPAPTPPPARPAPPAAGEPRA